MFYTIVSAINLMLKNPIDLIYGIFFYKSYIISEDYGIIKKNLFIKILGEKI